MMEKLFPETEPKQRLPIPAKDSTLALDLSATETIADVVTDDLKQMLVKLAGNEQVSQWSAAIAQWMQQHSGGEAVSLHKLQQALGREQREKVRDGEWGGSLRLTQAKNCQI